MLPAQPNQSLIDGMACLQAVATSPEPVGVRKLARELGLEPSRVSRLLGTLAHLGFARRTPSRRFEPGPAMHVLSAQALRGSRMLQKAFPFLTALGAGNPGLNVALGVLWHDQVCYLYHGRPGALPDPGIFHFDPFPVAKSTIGLTILAHSADPVPKGVRASDLRGIRRDGWCVLDRGGGERSVAVPLGNPAVAAIAFAGKIPARKIPDLRRQLLQAALSLNQTL